MVAEPLPQTRPEQELYVRQVKRTCRGEMVFADEVLRNKFRDRLGYLQEQEQRNEYHPSVLQALYDEMQAAVGVTRPKLLENWTVRFNTVFEFLFSFKDNCGADFNDIICAGPFDGKEHAYTCRCGQQGSYVAPHFEVLAQEIHPPPAGE